MKKDKEWAKGQLEYYIKAVGNPFNSRTQCMINAYKNVEHIIDQLDEPQKPVIPQFVADWIESYREKLLVELLYDAVYSSSEEISAFRRWFHDEMGFESNYSEFLSRAWLDGYEVEKEKRYYISDEMDNATLMTFDLSDESGKEIIEFVVGYSENETIHFDSKEKAELIARFVGDSVKVEEVTE